MEGERSCGMTKEEEEGARAEVIYRYGTLWGYNWSFATVLPLLPCYRIVEEV